MRLCLGIGSPAKGKGSGEEGLEIADGEEHVALQPKASSGENHVAEIIAHRRQWILLRHRPNARQLTPGLGGIDAQDEADAPCDWKIGPVDTIASVAVVRLQQIVEDLLFIQVHVLMGVVIAMQIRATRVGRSIVNALVRATSGLVVDRRLVGHIGSNQTRATICLGEEVGAHTPGSGRLLRGRSSGWRLSKIYQASGGCQLRNGARQEFLLLCDKMRAKD